MLHCTMTTAKNDQITGSAGNSTDISIRLYT